MNIELKFLQFLIKSQTHWKLELFSGLKAYIKQTNPTNNQLIDYLDKEINSTRTKHLEEMEKTKGSRIGILEKNL